jgi:hypothetical protein
VSYFLSSSFSPDSQDYITSESRVFLQLRDSRNIEKGVCIAHQSTRVHVGYNGGCCLLPLLTDKKARDDWPNKELIQISEAMTARAIRTPDWVYCVADPEANTRTDKSGTRYHEYLFYDERGDPNEIINLAARKEFRKQADMLRDELKKMIVAAGESEPEIVPAKLYT